MQYPKATEIKMLMTDIVIGHFIVRPFLLYFGGYGNYLLCCHGETSFPKPLNLHACTITLISLQRYLQVVWHAVDGDRVAQVKKILDLLYGRIHSHIAEPERSLRKPKSYSAVRLSCGKCCFSFSSMTPVFIGLWHVGGTLSTDIVSWRHKHALCSDAIFSLPC